VINMSWKDILLKGREEEIMDAIDEYNEFVEYLDKLKEKGELPMNINQLGEHFEEVEEVVERINELAEYINKLVAEVKTSGDTFEKRAGGFSFVGHGDGPNPEAFGIRYRKRRKKKDGEEVR